MNFHLGVYTGSPYWYHRYSIHVGYPFIGYYWIYDYPYLASYGCGFYSGFYVRFGPWRASYYAVCPRFGVHYHPHHHCHSYACDVHGTHYYHRRDCEYCYPSGSVVYQDSPIVESVETVQVDEAPDPGTLSPVDVQPVAEAETNPASLRAIESGSELPPGRAAAQLTPSQVTVSLGMVAHQRGDYNQASEYFFNASVEDSESAVVKLLLSSSLVAIGEYDYAASYLRMALDSDPSLIDHRFDISRLYGEENAGDLASHRALLEERAEVFPSDPETQLLAAYVSLNSGDLDRAGVHALALRDAAERPADREIAQRLIDEAIERREQEPGLAEPTDPVAAFLARPSVDDVAELPIR